MYDRMVEPSALSSRWTARSTDETLRRIETQVVALKSQHSSLMIHKRAIERQLASIAAQIHEPDAEPTPYAIFLLLEVRGSGGVSEQLEQIAHLVHEQGYLKPNGRVQNYRLQDVYRLGKSTQRLFDDYAVINRRVEQLHARLGHIKQHWQMEVETSIQGIFECLATAMDVDATEVQSEINALVELLESGNRKKSWRGRSRTLSSLRVNIPASSSHSPLDSHSPPRHRDNVKGKHDNHHDQ